MSRQAAPQTTVEVPLAFACLAYAGVAVALFPETYLALGIPYAATLVRTLPPMLLFGLAVAAMVARPAAPFAFIRDLWSRRCRGAAATVLVFFIGMTAFSTFKHHLPPMAGFYADPSLADLDEALHGGPAWALAHAIAPGWAGAALFWLYGLVWFTQWFGFVLFAAFLPRDRLRARYLMSFAATLFVLGTLTAAAGASGGPIFYDRIAGAGGSPHSSPPSAPIPIAARCCAPPTISSPPMPPMPAPSAAASPRCRASTSPPRP